MTLARRTLEAIDSAMRADGGAAFRKFQKLTLPECHDAYSGERDDGMRRHLGASQMGDACSRKLWYGFHWAGSSRDVEPSMMRLWNRGHLEEGRMVALLMMIGVQVFQHDENGKQFRITDHGGHFGGSLDSELLGVPDMPTERMLGEYKTHNDKSFDSLISNGLHESKFEHYVQVSIYMRKRNLRYCLYMAVNKNNDKLHAEIVELNQELADRYIARGGQVIEAKQLPPKINEAPSWYQCKWCDFRGVCHFKEAPLVNCRTCTNSTPVLGGWACALAPQAVLIPTEVQRVGCPSYTRATWT